MLKKNKSKSKASKKFVIGEDKLKLLDKRVGKFLDITKMDEK